MFQISFFTYLSTYLSTYLFLYASSFLSLVTLSFFSLSFLSLFEREPKRESRRERAAEREPKRFFAGEIGGEIYVERDRARKNVFLFVPKGMLSLFWNKKNKVVALSPKKPKYWFSLQKNQLGGLKTSQLVFGSKKAKHPFASSSKKKNGDAFAFLEQKSKSIDLFLLFFEKKEKASLLWRRSKTDAFAFLEPKNSWEVEKPPNRFFAGERYSERDMRRAGRKNASNLGKKNLRFLSLRLLLGGGKKRKKLRIISPALLKKEIREIIQKKRDLF